MRLSIAMNQVPADIKHSLTVYDSGEIEDIVHDTERDMVTVHAHGHVSVKAYRLDVWEVFSLSEYTHGGLRVTFRRKS